MKKKVSGPGTGSLVFVRGIYGDKAGQADEDVLYKIVRIGPKLATLKQVDINSPHTDLGRRNFTVRLFPQEDRNSALNRGWFYPTTWSQYFVEKDQAGWDSQENW